jgi:hypothetical protein
MVALVTATTAVAFLVATPPAAASTAPRDSVSLPMRVQLTDGRSFSANWVRLQWNDFLHIVDPAGRATHVPAFKVRDIQDSKGNDLTRRVLDKHEVLGIKVEVTSAIPDTVRSVPHSPLSGVVAQGSYFFRADSYDPTHEAPVMVQVDIGTMVQVDERHSLGGTVFLSTDEEITSMGLKARGRRLFGPHVVVDLAPGVIIATSDELKARSFAPGFVGEAALTVNRWISLAAETEVRQRVDATKHTDWSWYLGAKLGGPAGVPAVVVALAAIFLIQVDTISVVY